MGTGWSGCGNDQVNDSPQKYENYGCPAFPETPNS